MNIRQIAKSKIAVNLGKTLLFYLLAVVAITVLEKIEPSGPCTLGFGFALLFATIPIVIILAGSNLVKIAKGDRTHIASLAVHMIVLVCFLLSTCTKQ